MNMCTGVPIIVAIVCVYREGTVKTIYLFIFCSFNSALWDDGTQLHLIRLLSIVSSHEYCFSKKSFEFFGLIK